MRRAALALTAVALTHVVGVSARADGPPPAPVPPSAVSPYVDWQPGLIAAFDLAKKEGKPLFLAINAEHVLGKSRVEPAGKELREHTYLDPAVVAKSRAFVCVLLRPDGTGADYDELRSRLGIQGEIVSPQHVFVHADGALIDRKEYWSYGPGAASVTALLALMDGALSAHKAKLEMNATGGVGTPEERRAAWIHERIVKVRAGASDHAARDVSIQELVRGDQKGDCVTPLCALLLEPKKDPDTVVAIVRGLGKPGLEVAVAPVAGMLDDSTDAVRSNAAVTLEYIGSATAIEALTKRLTKEKDELVRNNCCRALGRCGVKQEAVRKALLRELQTAKTNKLSTGPAIGLSYFERDADAARGIEKILGPGVDWQKRAFALYALTQIHDPKSADFVKEKVLKGEKNQAALPFLNAVVAVLAGTDANGQATRDVTRGMESAVGTLGDIGGDARKGRDQAEFVPNGEFVPAAGADGDAEPLARAPPPVTRKRRWARAALWAGALPLALLVTAFGYDVAQGSPNPVKMFMRRAEAALRHQHLLPRRPWSAVGSGRGNIRFFGPDGAHVTLEYITKRDRVYALGVWPIGTNYTAREVSNDVPLDCQAVRLVWWSGTERHVVDTADRANGRLPAGATSVEVKGWIPFEASRYGVEESGSEKAPTEWREAWSNGYAD